MEYNQNLDIINLRHEDFKDELTADLTALVYILGKPILNLEESIAANEFRPDKDTFFVGPQVFGVILRMLHDLIPVIEKSEYAEIYNASIKAVTTLYRDKIFTDVRDKYTEATEIDKSLVEVGELDSDEVVEFTDDDYNAHVDVTLLPRLGFINLAFYVTYKKEYDLLKLDDIHNPEFWYNKYFDLFIHNMNYLDFLTAS